MITVPFDVNDSWLRRTFLTEVLRDRIGMLDEEAKPAWGAMSPRHMIEHLLWTFEVSTGKLVVPCVTPEKLLPRVKRFLYNSTPTPQGFRNPLLGDELPPYREESWLESKSALLKEQAEYSEHFSAEPGTIHVHPLFGPLGAEEWDRALFKHCYHHLLQFNLIREPVTSVVEPEI